MLRFEGVSRTVLGRTLFRDVRWTIHRGDRIGLIGPNGCGKTTLLEIACGRREPDEGRVEVARGTRIAYLPQELEAELPVDATPLEAALAGAEELRRIGDELAELEERIAAAAERGEDAGALGERYGERRALFEWFGGDAIEARARAVLGGLGFGPDEMERPLATFSGGWRRRALLARLLLSGADLLLLDEPTNHLDLEALGWLENQLAATPAALVVVSHDRVFLDRVTNRTADFLRGRLRVTKGGYGAWARRREEERRQAEQRARRLRGEEERLARFVERFAAKPAKASQARDRAQKLARVQEELARIEVDPDWNARLRWPAPPEGPDLLVELKGVVKRFPGKTVLAGVDLVIRRGEHLAVLGPNGAGKTTLLRLLSGELLPDGGHRRIARGVRVARFAQHQLEEMDRDRTVLEEARRAAPGRREEELRAALGMLGLGPGIVDRAIGTLSGGERARLGLARLILRPAHLLLLDEPTNHLDLPLREALEGALAGWPGALLVVSHDRAFLDRTARETLAVEAGQARRLAGGWEAWLAWRSGVREGEGSGPAGAAHPRSRAGRRERAEAVVRRSRSLRPLREKVERLEREIEALERRRRAIDEKLADPATHRDGAAMRRLAREREEASRRIEAAYAAWEQAAAALDAPSD